MRKVYLDNHTAVKPHPGAIRAMLPFLEEHWGSSVAPHQMGQELFSPLDAAVKEILDICGAEDRDQFYFFSSRAEAISHLYFSHYLDGISKTGKNHLLATNVEEAPILMSLKRMEELGCSGKILSVNGQGQLTKEILEGAIGPRTSLLSLSWANGLTGVIHPVEDIAELCREKGVQLHVDASSVLGKRYFRLEDLPIDFLTFEGNLVHAPQGTAGLIIKEKVPFTPAVSLMAGRSAWGISALAAALEKNGLMFDHMCLETARLRDRFEKGLVAAIPDAFVLFSQAERLPNCTAIAFPGAESDALLYLLNKKGVYASLGGGHTQKLFHVLVASGVEMSIAHSALSFSLSFETTEEEIEYAIEAITASVLQLRSCSAMIRRYS